MSSRDSFNTNTSKNNNVEVMSRLAIFDFSKWTTKFTFTMVE